MSTAREIEDSFLRHRDYTTLRIRRDAIQRVYDSYLKLAVEFVNLAPPAPWLMTSDGDFGPVAQEDPVPPELRALLTELADQRGRLDLAMRDAYEREQR